MIASIGHIALLPLSLYLAASLFGQLANVWLPQKTSGSMRKERRKKERKKERKKKERRKKREKKREK